LNIAFLTKQNLYEANLMPASMYAINTKHLTKIIMKLGVNAANNRR